MKKTLLTILALVLAGTTFSTAQAYSSFADVPENAAGVKNILKSQDELNKAIVRRRSFNYKNSIQDATYNSVPDQIRRHILGRKAAGVSERSTQLKREGALTDFAGRKEGSTSTLDNVGNAKNVMRNRAVDYYVEGGVAGTDYLKSTGVKARDHKVIPGNIFSRLLWRSSQSDIVGTRNDDLRDLNGLERAPTNSPDGNRFARSKSKAGYNYKNYSNPYQGFEDLEGIED